jgi:hypothetical protein
MPAGGDTKNVALPLNWSKNGMVIEGMLQENKNLWHMQTKIQQV